MKVNIQGKKLAFTYYLRGVAEITNVHIYQPK